MMLRRVWRLPSARAAHADIHTQVHVLTHVHTTHTRACPPLAVLNTSSAQTCASLSNCSQVSRVPEDVALTSHVFRAGLGVYAPGGPARPGVPALCTQQDSGPQTIP